tara:strand:+ start:338 stop:826 length:489 start_codon:yes stop_codon:yes gene_type:complete
MVTIEASAEVDEEALGSFIHEYLSYNIGDHIDIGEIASEVCNDLDLDDINEFYNLREKVEELEEKLADQLSPSASDRAQLESKIRAQGMMIEGLTNHVLELEERMRLAAGAFTNKIINEEEMANGGIQRRERSGFTGCGDDQTSDEAERATEGEVEARGSTE